MNTYRRFDDYSIETAEAYWKATEEFWAGVRDEWNAIEAENTRFAITIQGENEALYTPLLGLAGKVQDKQTTVDAAIEEARTVIRSFVTPDIGALTDRLRSDRQVEEVK